MKRKFVFFVLVVFFISLFSGHIQIIGKTKKFQIFNEKTGKIITYCLINPGKEISFRVFDVDTLKVFSRIILVNENKKNYKYEIISEKQRKVINKEAVLSKISVALDGSKVSKYNLSKIVVTDKDDKFSIRNISEEKLLVKINSEDVSKSNRNIEFVNFTPTKHGKEQTIRIGEKSFTYFFPQNENIEFTLEGPIILKIVSRMIFNDNLVKKYKYDFNVYDNGKLTANVKETAFKSAKAVLENDNRRILSAGDVNVFKLSNGIHKITIENKNKNRELIFRFYISKAGIKIKEL
jgi:hypothetical protein